MFNFGLYESHVQYLGKIDRDMTKYAEIIMLGLILDSSVFKNCLKISH